MNLPESTVKKASKSKSVPTAIVLSLASMMVSVGGVAYWNAHSKQTIVKGEEDTGPIRVRVDNRTPEQAAESFLDAWRKRAHEDALAVSTGIAADRVRSRMRAEDRLSQEDRASADALWRKIADMRLAFQVHQSENLEGGRVILHGTSVGTWLGKPYAREMDFTLVGENKDYKVSDFHFGAIHDGEDGGNLPIGE